MSFHRDSGAVGANAVSRRWIVLRISRMQVLRGSAPDLSVVTRSVRSQTRGSPEVRMVQRPISRNPGVGEQPDTTCKIPLDGHLLHIQKGYVLPT